MENPVSDIEIIQKVTSGNVQAFAEIVRKYQEKVLRLCISMVDERMAEDATQEIFLKVYESLAEFEGRSAFSTWLYRIASNHCLNIISKRKNERLDSLDGLTEKYGESLRLLRVENHPSKQIENKQMVEAIFKQISPEEKLILTLREMEGFSYKELSELLQIPIETVKVRLFRARQSFKNILNKIDPSRTH